MDSSPAGYTVKQVAALTGILETTLRMWQRRYGVVDPVRSPGGYRLYSDADVARLRAMAALVNDGVPASVAARSVAPALKVEHAEKRFEMGRSPRPDLVGAAASLNSVSLADVLDRALKFAPLEQVLDKWLMPELARLGQAWASGEVSVAEEHFASAGVMRALGRVYDELPDAERPEVLVGLPEGSHHQVGLMSFAVCLRRLGVGVVYLGDDVPVADWEAAAGTLQPRAAVVGVPLCSKVAKAQEVVDRLNAASPPIAVWAGGSLAPKVRRAQQLSDAVAEAADEVSTALRAGAMH